MDDELHQLQRGSAEGANCDACPYSSFGAPNRPVFSESPEDPAFLIIGEAPGYIETMRQRPFISPTGNIVDQVLHKIGRRRDHVFIGHAALCMPPQGVPELDRERAVACCAPRLKAELAAFPGKPVLTLGAVTARAVIPKAILDAIDPPDTPKAIKKAQKLRQQPTLKQAQQRRKIVNKIRDRRMLVMLAHHRKGLIVEAKRRGFKRPDEAYLRAEAARVHGKLLVKAAQDAIKEFELRKLELEAKRVSRAANPTKKKSSKKIKLTDIVGTLFDIDVDGSGERPVIPAVHPASLLKGGGASIGGSHTPDMAFVNLVYDAGKCLSLSQGKDIRLRFNIEFELHDPERAVDLFLQVYREALVEGACSLDLETYVEDDQRHSALMAYVAKIRVLGLATATRQISLNWDLLPAWCWSLLQVLIGSVEMTYHNGLYDRTVMLAYGFIMDDRRWFDCYLDEETEFLTRDGWCPFGRIADDAWLGTVNADGALEWQQAFARVMKSYDGELLTFETNYTRAVVTPNHRMWVQPMRRTSRDWRGTPIGPWGFQRADDLLNASTDTFLIQQACAPQHADHVESVVDPSYLRLLGLWLADGSVRLHNGKATHIRISQKQNGHASALLRELATVFPLRMHETLHDEAWRSKACLEEIWVLHDHKIAQAFCALGQHSRERRLPDFIFSLGIEARKTFLEALFLGDGSQHGGRGDKFIYRSGSEMLADGVQALALSVGWTATNPPSYRPDDICHVFIGRTRGHTAPLRARTSGANARVTRRRGKGHIVCFSVPNETLITRSKGKPAFYGNTLLAHHAAFPGNSHKLQTVGAQFYGVPAWKSEFRNAEEDPEGLAKYNAQDTGVTHALRKPLVIHMKRRRTEQVYELDKKMSSMASRMHLAGMPVDRDINDELLKTFSTQVKESRRAVEDIARDKKLREQVWHHLALQQAAKKRKIDPDDFEERYLSRLDSMRTDPDWKWKINAGKHISALLLAMGVPLIARTKGGDISTKKDVLETLLDVPVVRDIVSFRENDKLLSTFIWGTFDRYVGGELVTRGYADPNSRIHPIWNVHRISGRWASQTPVVSNVPKDKWKKLTLEEIVLLGALPEGGKFERNGTWYRINKDHSLLKPSVSKMTRPNLRRQIKAPPGRIFVGFDYGQIEARVVALISGDPFLCAIFAEGRDPHVECARIIWPNFDKLDSDTAKALRENVKNIEYGFMYMAQLDTLHQTMLKAGNLIKKADLAMAIGKLAQAMAGIPAWQRATIARAMTPPHEACDFLLGRVRSWPMGQVDGPEAVNSDVQPAAAAIMNTGMARFAERIDNHKDVEPIGQFHDAAVFECWEGDHFRVGKDVKEAFEQQHDRDGRSIPFPIDLKYGYTWDTV